MAKTLNFNNVKKNYLTVTLKDGTILMVSTPTKSVMTDLMQLRSGLSNVNDIETLDDLYTACARIMSRNKTGKTITKEYLEEIFDFEDIIVFFQAYMEFISELSNSKN